MTGRVTRIIGKSGSVALRRGPVCYGWICTKCGNVTLEYRGTRVIDCLNPDCDGNQFDPTFVMKPVRDHE